MKLVPLSNRIVLKEFEAEEKTKGGIILTSAQQQKPQWAQVIAVGPGRMEEGKLIPMEVKVGDKVIYASYAGTKVDLEDEQFIIVSSDDILAIVE